MASCTASSVSLNMRFLNTSLSCTCSFRSALTSRISWMTSVMRSASCRALVSSVTSSPLLAADERDINSFVDTNRPNVW